MAFNNFFFYEWQCGRHVNFISYFTSVVNETGHNGFSVIFFCKRTWLLHCRIRPVEHQPIESVTVDNDAHFKDHDKTKQSQRVERPPPIQIVRFQMSIATAAPAIPTASRLCFASRCGREKNLDNGFHLPPSQTHHTSTGSTHYLCIANTGGSFHHTTSGAGVQRDVFLGCPFYLGRGEANVTRMSFHSNQIMTGVLTAWQCNQSTSAT